MDFKDKPDTNFRNIDDLTKEDAADQVRALRKGINYHDHLYYVKNAPKISDPVYDKLFKRLEILEAAFPALKSAPNPSAS